MHTILVMLGSIALVAGALAGAAALCWLLWHLCRYLHHPEWAALLILLLVLLALTGNLPRSGLLNMALAFALAATVPLWIAGRNWRRRWTGSEPVAGAGS